MGSRRPKKQKTEGARSDVNTVVAAAIDVESHDRIVGNLKNEIVKLQDRCKELEDRAEKYMQDGLSMASDYRSRFDQMGAEIKAALSSMKSLKEEKLAQELLAQERENDLVADHGRAVKALRDRIDELEFEKTSLQVMVIELQSRIAEIAPVECTDGEQTEHVAREPDHEVPGEGTEAEEHFPADPRQEAEANAGSDQQV
jgi:chromosome segregation ATPase